MSVTVSLGKGFLVSCKRATMRTLAACVRTSGVRSDVLTNAFSPQEEEFAEAAGAWNLDGLGLNGFVALRRVFEEVEGKLPQVAAHWSDEHRPEFAREYALLRDLLNRRIDAMNDPSIE